MAGCLMVLPVRSGMQSRVPPDQIPILLASEKWQDNVDALKTLVRQKRPFPLKADASGLAANPSIPVRYWLARSLSQRSAPKTYAILMKLMDDPQPIVTCQALYSLGKRKEANAIRNVLHKINQSDHWYVQWYGYNALKALGWRQKSSI
jgi:HEAT repeat protein